ncbi:CHAT domain-containing protein, partial [Chloroflexus sp.]|uniref:CHAT domain-containing protein n=1 Tax=Chloroflexus sp. TaxID=1904827 RepID=UPI00261444D2
MDRGPFPLNHTVDSAATEDFNPFTHPDIAAAYRELRAAALNRADALRLLIVAPDRLHALRWEQLSDPVDGKPLALANQVWVSRYLRSDDITPLEPRPRGAMRAIVAVAAPTDAERWSLPPIDGAAELQRAREALTRIDIKTEVVTAEWDAISAGLRQGYDLLYLVAHGRLIDGEPWLYLTDTAGRVARRNGADLVELLATLPADTRPRLVALVSCAGAGDDRHSPLVALGPRLARAGVPAVLAAYGNLTVDTAARFLPVFFDSLQRDGQVDYAVQQARLAADQAGRPDWGAFTLFCRLRDGRLWLTASERAAVGAPPFLVPYRSNHLFRGREEELESLANILLKGSSDGAPAVVAPVVSGTGGIGKTQLAVEFVHRYHKHFPGGVFWLDMSDPDGVKLQVARCGEPDGLNLPGFSSLSLDEKVAAVRRAWQESVLRLLVFDNLEDPALLKEWRPVTGGARVLVTSRKTNWRATTGVRIVPLAPLPRMESRYLLLSPRAQAQGTSVDDILADAATKQAADAICDLVGDLPLALALAGAYLEEIYNLPLIVYQQRLEQTLLDDPSLSNALARDAELPTGYPRGVAAAIELSYQHLRADAAQNALRLFHSLAWLAPEPIPQPLVNALAGGDTTDLQQIEATDKAINRLLAVGLLERTKDGAQMHRLLAAYGRRRDPDPDGHFAAAIEATLTALEQIDLDRAPQDGAPYRAHLLALCQQEKQNDRLNPQTATRLLDQTGYLLYAQGDYAAARPL